MPVGVDILSYTYDMLLIIRLLDVSHRGNEQLELASDVFRYEFGD